MKDVTEKQPKGGRLRGYGNRGHWRKMLSDVEVQSRSRYLLCFLFIEYVRWNSVHEGGYYPLAGIGYGWPLTEKRMNTFSWDM